jgi:competence protein ComEA
MRPKKWRYLFNEYFTFTRRERNGIFVLATILILLQLSILILHYLPDPEPLLLDASTLKKISDFENTIRSERKNKFKKFANSYPDKKTFAPKKQNELFPFNPNTNLISDWIRLGFSEKQAMGILHWKERSGKFKRKEDLAKVWMISPEKFRQLEPWIKIPASDTVNEKPVFKKFDPSSDKWKRQIPVFELNTVAETSLTSLPMIGEGRARSIIRYRDFLGGFISPDQLSEVYGLPDSVIKRILPQLKIDPEKRKLLNINTSDLNELKHPYLSKQQSRMIVSYRLEHGNYKTTEEIKQLPLFDEDLYRKIAPYLKVNP